ncbi:MAG: Na(+)-translocating NADH-quinone reductase subunit C [Pseudomonadota bacterium]
MADKDSVKQTLIVALLICIVCSVVVATTAVALKPDQQRNKLLDRNKNILAAAGLYDEDQHSESDIPQLFEQFSVGLADLQEKTLLTAEQAAEQGIDLSSYDQRKASKDPSLSKALSGDEDIAGIGRRERYANVYMLKDGDDIQRIVLPVRGYGLWGTLYGFMALEGDMDTVAGLGFFEHKETPGLGAEVDNPKWKAIWVGKEIYAEDMSVAAEVLKGAVIKNNPNEIYQIDGLSGATLTSRGVSNLVEYWMGDSGYGPLLATLRQ